MTRRTICLCPAACSRPRRRQPPEAGTATTPALWPPSCACRPRRSCAAPGAQARAARRRAEAGLARPRPGRYWMWRSRSSNRFGFSPLAAMGIARAPLLHPGALRAVHHRAGPGCDLCRLRGHRHPLGWWLHRGGRRGILLAGPRWCTRCRPGSRLGNTSGRRALKSVSAARTSSSDSGVSALHRIVVMGLSFAELPERFTSR